MSELKVRRAYFSEDEYDRGTHKICAKVSDCGYDRRNDWWSYAFEDDVYLKSEADKVIAEKDAEIARLKDIRKVHVEAIESMGAGLLQDYDEIRHQKYKRCLAMAKWCRTSARYDGSLGAFKYRDWYLKWLKRWLKIAEQFKEAK